jgi:hypothetical protein
MLRQWATLIGVALLGLLALYMAAEANTQNGYILGLAMAVGCVLLSFQVLRRMLDPRPGRLIDFMPRTRSGGTAMVVVMGLICLGAIYLAASGDPYLYHGGLGVAAAAFVMALLGIRASIDGRADGHAGE